MNDVSTDRAAINDDRRSPRRLYRSTDDKLVAGVCGGLARYLNLDPTLVRVVVGLLTLFSLGFPAVIGYIVLIFVMPERSPAGHALDFRERAPQEQRERSGNAEPSGPPHRVTDPGPPPVFLPEEDGRDTQWPVDPATLWINAKNSAGEAVPGPPEQERR